MATSTSLISKILYWKIPFNKVLLLSLGSVPFWILLVAIKTPPLPSKGQLINTALVALFSGILATSLFLFARNKSRSASELAAVDATQSSEVIFAMIRRNLDSGFPLAKWHGPCQVFCWFSPDWHCLFGFKPLFNRNLMVQVEQYKGLALVARLTASQRNDGAISLNYREHVNGDHPSKINLRRIILLVGTIITLPDTRDCRDIFFGRV